MRYKVVADSSANVYERDGMDYTSVPLKIVTSEKEYSDVKGTDIAEMVTYLQGYKGKSGTSCPNVHDWLEAFGDADLVLGVTITSNLSGSYASAMQAKAEYEESHPGAKVHIVDSLSAGPELELIIEKMEEVLETGKSFDEMTQEIAEYCRHSHLLFALKHLDNLARNGRVNPAIAKLAGILGIRVIGKASDEGTLQQLHKCRGESQSVSCIFNEMKKHGYDGGKVRIAHCFNPQMAQSLSDTIHQYYPLADVRICPCTALCSFYAEEGGLMIGYEG
ncbi:MAG: DegV family protein [Lachnospiraceae bacterium]|nr:DegV family protein [Lachnospiraceae bacterium]